MAVRMCWRVCSLLYREPLSVCSSCGGLVYFWQTWYQLVSNVCIVLGDCAVQVQCCFMSTETVRTIRDREPRTATSTFTQLLSSVILQCSSVDRCSTI